MYNPISDVLTMVGSQLAEDEPDALPPLTRSELLEALDARTAGEIYLLAEALAAVAAGLAEALTDNPRALLASMGSSWAG